VIDRIDLLLASRGNHFMVEIAELYQSGFEQLGVPCRIAFDEPPNKADSPSVYPVIVAPHEYFELYADKAYGRSRRRGLASRAAVLNTERPGSPWFDLSWTAARHAQAVFDMNQSGAAAFVRLGVPAIYAPIGYAPTLENVGGPHDNSKPIDVVFLGHAALKRDRFFARHRDLFQRYECRLLFVPINRIRGPHTPNCVFGPERNRLLRSAKVLINIHATDGRYFEWHRALCAIANRCLLVTETSDGVAPLVPGEHIVMAEEDCLAEVCEHYLRDTEARVAVTERAYRLLRDELSIEGSCRSILNSASSEAAAPVRRTLAVQVADGRARAHQVGRQLFLVLCYNRLTKAAFAAWLRVRTTYLQWFRVRAYTARRDAIVCRLASVDRTEAGCRRDYSAVDNAAYLTRAKPAVSVVVTLYNYARYVRACLESAAASEINELSEGIEIVVVDDASTDGGADVVSDFMSACPVPLRLVRKSTNTGLADARNVGLREARADYVFILDADNLVYPRCLERLYQTMRSDNLAASFGVIACFDDQTGEGVGLLSAFAWNVRQLVHGAYLDAMALFDRAKVLAVDGYSTELVRYGWFGWEDYDLWLKLAEAGHECLLCPQIVAAYRVHSASMIRVTNAYLPNFVRYFNEKFAALVERMEPIDFAFGWPRTTKTGRVSRAKDSKRQEALPFNREDVPKKSLDAG